MLRIGETIDRYRVEALIGQGGMAAVYRARHVQLDSEHAIKVLFITAPLIKERLLREGRVQAALRHPNIVSVTDVLEVQGAPALVMEYVNGPALDQWLLENKPTLEESLWLFRGIVRGIGAAHERGVIHRDLKPANVLLAPTNEGIVPKVTDFGLVKSIAEQKGHTQTGLALGTPEYMSPEQIRDASDVDTRADMWALGCILYELICHRRAFSGPDKMSTFNAIVAGTYEPPRKFHEDLPRSVAEAIRVLLEVDRTDRLSSSVELFDLLYEDNTVGRLGAPTKPAAPLVFTRPGDTPLGSPSPAPAPSPGGSSGPSPLSVLSDEPTAGLGDVPTGLPANRRVGVPTGLRNARPPAPPSEVQVEDRSRGFGWLIAIAGPMLLVVGVALGVGVAMLTRDEGDPSDRPIAAPTLGDHLPTPQPTPAGPEPEPVGEATDGTVAPQPAPAPPEPRPAPVPPRPPPEPVVVAPAPEPTPVPPPNPKVIRIERSQPTTAEVRITGDAKGVWLVSNGTRHDPGQPLAAGSYDILADFGGASPVKAGSVDLSAGEQIELACSSYAYRCTVR